MPASTLISPISISLYHLSISLPVCIRSQDKVNKQISDMDGDFGVVALSLALAGM